MQGSLVFSIIDFGSPLFAEVIHLRDIVLRRPLGLEFTTQQIVAEADDFHFCCTDSELCNVLGTLLMHEISNTTLKMRQVAVHPKRQRDGIGSYMVTAIESWARHRGYSNIELSARDEAVAFYQHLSYSIEGEQFLEVGIPHLRMTKKL